jgi:putative DNA primase/helicase
VIRARTPRTKSEDGRKDAAWADPATEADKIISACVVDDYSTLCYWHGHFLKWSDGLYHELSKDEVRALTVNFLNERFSKVGSAVTTNVLEQLRAKTILPSKTVSPSWLEPHKWNPLDVFATSNALVHLPSFADKARHYMHVSTPKFFNTSATDYDFLPIDPGCPAWLQFLQTVWPDDIQSIQLLQEWFGYCLTPDTRQQKILLVPGPQRSGKGTISRVLRSVIGEQNVAGPTLSSLQTNFGLWPLLSKSLAVINDARLSGRSDLPVIIERLLSISGEDAQTVDRKNMEPITTKLSARIMIVSNDLPRLEDSSGALVGRMLLLRTTKSFYGQEDKSLTDRLIAERPGILHWAIQGWKRLRDRGHFVQPDSSTQLLEQMQELSSPIKAFIRDCCELLPHTEIECADLFKSWETWCEENGRHAGTSQIFGRDLRSAFPELNIHQRRVLTQRMRFYQGIRLNAL